MNKKIKILFNVFADEDNVNTQSLNARAIALGLNPEKFESYLFARNPDKRLLNKKSIHIIKLPPHLRSLVIAYQLIFGDYDIILYPPYGYLMTWYNCLIWLGKKKKLIYPVEGSIDYIKQENPRTYYRIIKTLRQSDMVIPVSEFTKKALKNNLNINSKIFIPLGVDTTFFSSLKSKKDKHVWVLFIGRIIKRKGHDLVLEAAKKFSDVQFRLIGSAYDKKDLAFFKEIKEKVVNSKLKNVHFLGKRNQEEVKEFMQNTDILILPSRLEGMPKVTLEAASSELPCIIFSDYKTPSVINNKTGFQVKTFEEFLEKLNLLIKNKNLRLRMGRAARKHAKKFDWSIIAKKWEKVFEDISRE